MIDALLMRLEVEIVESIDDDEVSEDWNENVNKMEEHISNLSDFYASVKL
jgi:hypothetical protein